MVEIINEISAALSAGVNPVTAIRQATGYSIEQLAIASGLAESELAALEVDTGTDISKLARLAAALGLPPDFLPAA